MTHKGEGENLKQFGSKWKGVLKGAGNYGVMFRVLSSRKTCTVLRNLHSQNWIHIVQEFRQLVSYEMCFVLANKPHNKSVAGKGKLHRWFQDDILWPPSRVNFTMKLWVTIACLPCCQEVLVIINGGWHTIKIIQNQAPPNKNLYHSICINITSPFYLLFL